MTQKHTSLSYWFRGLAILLLISFLMPSSVFAQSPFLRKASATQSNLTPLKENSSWGANIDAANLSSDLIQDGSFEAYSAQTQDDPYWSEYDSAFGTPLCTYEDCDYWEEAHPYNGWSWAWFGGTKQAVHTASVSQMVTFPSCGYGYLQFYLWIGYADPGSGTDDVFYAKIGGTTVFSANATQKNAYSSYQLVQIPVYLADGGTHTIEFSHRNTTQDVIFNLDDVSLTWNYCPTISGNTGVAGAALSYVLGGAQTVFADGGGNYSFTVPFGWSGTVTPSQAGYVFSPANRTYVNVLTDLIYQNYTAVPLYTIAGNTGIGDVTLNYTDGTPKTVMSQADGTYSFTVLSGWSGTVTASHPCFTFTPPYINHSSVLNNRTNQNYTPGSIDPSCADIDVAIGGGSQGHYGLQDATGARASFTNVDQGPVKITSTNGIPLIASQRINLKASPSYSSYSEFMGIPAGKLTDTYIFPWYNNATAGGVSSQIRFGNVGTASTVVTIKIGGVTMPDTYPLAPNESARVIFDNIDNGPVEVKSSDGVPIIASMRVNLKKMPTYSSYSEFMGLPSGSTPGTSYMFPWYNNATAGGVQSQIRFGNVGDAETDVTIKVGASSFGPYHLNVGESNRVSLDNVDAGPVEVLSSAGVPIIAAMRVNLKTMPTYSSYAEFMGLPGETLTETRYLFPWYNNATAGGVQSQIRFGNVGDTTTVVSIKIAGVTQTQTYTLAPNESARVTLNNVDSGPVEVFSNSQPIIASMRVNLKPNALYSSYSEFMGLSVGNGMPGDELSSTYWFPWYNNANAGGLSSQLRFGAP